MNTDHNPEEINRRKFLQTSTKLAASAMFLGVGGAKIFGAIKPAENSIATVTLNNGIKMPMLGFGTFMLNGDVCKNCVAEAIALGYRLIDTATIYGNEAFVGAGIKKGAVKREELFVTSKLWVDDMGYESAKKAFERTLDKLGLEYLDLYLIHRPRGDVKGSWKAMEELYATGKIRAIGVSNFESGQLDNLLASAKTKPAVNQVETHAFFQQAAAQVSLKQHDVQMEAWSPFAEGRNDLFNNATIAAIGKKYNKNNAQVSLRWLFQRGIVAIPRTSKKEHMIENLDIFDFKLDEADMQAIALLDMNTTQFPEWG